MRYPILLVAGTVATVIAACSSGRGLKVSTTTEPGASLTGLRTFTVLTPPTRAANAAALTVNDPMLENSITNRALRADLTQAFQARGYAPATQGNPDFNVAYYAGTKEKFDTTYWGPTYSPGWRYSYRGRRGWAWPYYGAGYYGGYANPWGGGASVSSYTQGQVIVDVTDPKAGELLWRGQGTEPVSSDPTKYGQDMEKVVTAIVAKFPQGSVTPTASSP
jgi:hypothetical protein